MSTFQPPVEIPTDVLKWMQTQSQSAFIGDMLRLYQRKGGIAQSSLDEVLRMYERKA